MSFVKLRIALGVAVSALGVVLLGSAAPQDADVDTLPNRVYVHRDAKTSVKVPTGWEITNPYRLRKSTTTTVLGLEKDNPRVAVTIIWSLLGKRPWGEVIRASEGDDLGEEYATLLTVYGKGKVSRPTTYKSGPYTVFKVLIDDGPEKTTAGAVYFLEGGSAESRWKIKVRAVFPLTNREEYIKQVEEVIANFAIAKETE
jgi:hypothetical protein